MMKIGVHARVLSEPRLNGIGYYVFNLLQSLLELDLSNEYTLISNSPLQQPLPKNRVETLFIRPSFAFTYLGFPAGCRKIRCDLAFVPREVVPPFLPNIPCVVTAYDLYYLKCPHPVPWTPYLHYLLAQKYHLKRADKILAISESTKRDLIEFCNIREERIAVTSLGANLKRFTPRTNSELAPILAKYRLTNPFLINTSSLWWSRKNLPRLIEAFSLLSEKGIDLVITGTRGSDYPKMVEAIHRLKLGSRVHLLDYVPNEDLPFLLAAATALVFPSLDEEYGLPVIEAMASGCPVITSNCSALPEVAGDAALLVDPKNRESILSAMETLIGEADLRKSLSLRGLARAKNFGWEHTARKTLEVFESLTS